MDRSADFTITQLIGKIPYRMALAGGWIETEVLFLLDGQVRGKEEYSDIKAGITFEEGLFSPAPWKKAGWIGQ